MGEGSDIDPIPLPGGRTVPAHAMSERATPSGGPGGQHANRSSTRIELRIDTWLLPLKDRERALVQRRLASRLTQEGVLVVTCDDERSQLRNRQVARRRAAELLAGALRRKRRRIPTRPSRSARNRAREQQRRRSQKKKDRRWRPGKDDLA